MEIRVNDIQDPDFRSRVEQVVSSRIRPMLRRCGGDLRLREIRGRDIYISFMGTCCSCPFAREITMQRVRDVFKEFSGDGIGQIHVVQYPQRNYWV
ncbi:MAG: NifU family protein [Marinifilaceae bacterium]|nr:NifU family protein [Marinifilaceae bacterium]